MKSFSLEMRKKFLQKATKPSFSVFWGQSKGCLMLLSDYPGLYHHHRENSVLAFGGGVLEARSEAQSYSLTSNSWKWLDQRMLFPLNFFYPCEYLCLVYLFTFDSPIQYYSLKTGIFRKIQVKTSAFDNYGCSLKQSHTKVCSTSSTLELTP